MSTTTDDRGMIEEVERLDAEATPGPWYGEHHSDAVRRIFLVGPDGEFAIRARTLLPALAKRLREVSADLKTRETALVALERAYEVLAEKLAMEKEQALIQTERAVRQALKMESLRKEYGNELGDYTKWTATTFDEFSRKLRGEPTVTPLACLRCGGTGVINTGNNDLPCDCAAGAAAVFNTAKGPQTGKEIRDGFTRVLPSSPEQGPVVRRNWMTPTEILRPFGGGGGILVVTDGLPLAAVEGAFVTQRSNGLRWRIAGIIHDTPERYEGEAGSIYLDRGVEVPNLGEALIIIDATMQAPRDSPMMRLRSFEGTLVSAHPEAPLDPKPEMPSRAGSSEELLERLGGLDLPLDALKPTPTLEELLEAAKGLPEMTPEQRPEQKISFVWGGLACSTNHKFTRAQVEAMVYKKAFEEVLADLRLATAALRLLSNKIGHARRRERWCLALDVIRAARRWRENPDGISPREFDEALAFWDAFEAKPPDPPPAAAKVAS
jgi:hypothetical protein